VNTEPAHRCISKWATKGKAPALADSDVGADHSSFGKARGVWHPTTSDEGDINDEDDKKMDDATPHNLKRPKAKRECHILIDSLPHLRPKRHQRKNEAGDAIDILDNDQQVADEVTKIPWVGTGSVRRTVSYFYQHTDSLISAAAVQGVHCLWGRNLYPASKPSKACTYCTKQRKACVPTVLWLKTVKMIRCAARQRGGNIWFLFG
jgi:hypothetical protein